MVAYAWRTGLIEFGEKCPDGALAIAAGDEAHLRPTIEALARHAYKRGQLLVPGVPEAENDEQAVKAMTVFSTRVHTSLREAA